MSGRLPTSLVVALAVIAGLGGASAARAATIVSINANFVGTVYDSGTGKLTVLDNADIVVEYDDATQATYAAGLFNLAADRVLDFSAGGLAMADFGNGTLSILDSGGNPLFAATGLTLTLTEVTDGGGLLAGAGQFTVTGGTLAPAFGAFPGDIVQITFRLNPKDISSFITSPGFTGFTGLSNISLTPTPEPATLGLMTLGLSLFLVRRRK